LAAVLLLAIAPVLIASVSINAPARGCFCSEFLGFSAMLAVLPKMTLAQMVDNALKDENFEALKSQAELF
jgi:hypothetical protein